MQARKGLYNQQQSNVILKKTPQLRSNMTVMIKIHSSAYLNLKKQDSSNNGKYYLNTNLQLDRGNSNSLVFHNFSKFDSYEFTFDQIYSHNARSHEIYSHSAICSSIVKQKKDVCALVIGGGQSGIHEITEGNNKKDGLFYIIISQIWEQLQREREKDDRQGYNNIKMSVKMLVQNNERLYDVLRPKSDVSLKQCQGRSHITGCSIHQIKSVFDLYSILHGGFQQKKMLYPDSILMLQLQITFHNEGMFMTDQDISKRYLTLIQWQKCTAEKQGNKINNNQSLLTLNMCLYQLYKYSCSAPNKVSKNQIKKLFAIFRNSPTTLLMRAYFLNNSRFLLLGCLSLEEKQEQENFHTLMIAKNFGKINLIKLAELVKQREQPHEVERVARGSHRKMKTEGVQAQSSNSSGLDLSRLKDNLKKILKQKEQIDCSKMRDDLVSIFKEQKRKLRQLQNLRYKREQVKFMEKLSKINNTLSINNSRVDSQDQKVFFPSLDKKKTPVDSIRKIDGLSVQEEVQVLEQRILEKAKESPSLLMRDVLKMEVKKHQQEMVGFIQHKNRLMDILKKQIVSLKPEKETSSNHTKSMSYSTQKKQKQKKKSSIWENTSKKSTNFQENSYPNPNPQPSFESSTIQVEPNQDKIDTLQKDMKRLRSLKKFNKVDYLFEKRRLMLKAKVQKGRQELNKFYSQAAQKFQQYRLPRKEQP